MFNFSTFENKFWKVYKLILIYPIYPFFSSSTTVSNGKVLAVVTSIGMQTEIGKIQSAVQDAEKEEEDTPLSKKIDEFGTQLSYVSLRYHFLICIACLILN